jgi:hypothetical protein
VRGQDLREALEKNYAGRVSMKSKSEKDVLVIVSDVVLTFWREEIVRRIRDNKWPITVAMWVCALALGFIGFAEYFAANGEKRSPWDIFYLTLQLFALESGSVTGRLSWELETARLLAPATTFVTAVQALSLIFKEQFQRLCANFYADHVVICGLGRRGLLMARSFRARGDRVVCIDQDLENDRVEQCRDLGAVVLIGNATDHHMLKKARVHTASCVIALCSADGVNAEIAVGARELVKGRRSNPLTCVIQVMDSHLMDLLRGQESGMSRAGSFRLEFFNAYERGARAVLSEHPPFSATSDSVPHLLVIGIGRMGRTIVTHAARTWGTSRRGSDKRLKITMLDREAKAHLEYMHVEFPLLDTVCDLRALQMDVTSAEFYRGDFLFDDEGGAAVTSIYVCLDNDSRAMSAALALMHRVQGLSVPMVVRLSHEGGLGALFQDAGAGTNGSRLLIPFGLSERTCTPELVLGGTNETLARAMHEEVLFQAADKRDMGPYGNAAVPWEELPKRFQNAFRRHADHVCAMLAEVGCYVHPLTSWQAEAFTFFPEEIETMARMEHEHRVMESVRGDGAYFPSNGRTIITNTDFLGSWKACPPDLVRRYKEIVSELPAFLVAADFEIARIGNRNALHDAGKVCSPV